MLCKSVLLKIFNNTDLKLTFEHSKNEEVLIFDIVCIYVQLLSWLFESLIEL